MVGLELARRQEIRISQAEPTEPITMELPPVSSHTPALERDKPTAPAEWIDALARADDDIAHGRTVSVDEALDELHAQLAEKGENQLPKLVQGITFTNGVEVINTPAQSAAGSRHHPNPA